MPETKTPSDPPAANGVVNKYSGTSREMLVLSSPLVIAFLSYSAKEVVDAAVTGRLGTAQQGGVGMGAFLVWTLFGLYMGTMTGVNTFVSQSLGAGKTNDIHKWVATAFYLIIPLWIMVIPFYIGLPSLVDLLRTTPEVRPYMIEYSRWLTFCAPFMMIHMVLTSYLRGLGDTITPMIVAICAVTLNTVLDIVLVFGVGPFPRMEVAGAALATILAFVLESVILLWVYLGKKHNRLYHTRRFYFPSAKRLLRFLKIGLPIGIGEVLMMVAWDALIIYVGFLSPSDLAASTVMVSVLHFSFMPVHALSISGITLVGQYLGAERPELAKKSAKVVMVWSIGIALFLGIVFVVFRTPLISSFNPDPEVIRVGSIIFIVAAFLQFFDGIGIAISGVLRGAGDTRFPMLAQLFTGWFLFIPSIFILGQKFELGVIGAWVGGTAFAFVLALILLWRYRQGNWLLKTISSL